MKTRTINGVKCRRLEVGEKIREGDLFKDGWKKKWIKSTCIGCEILSDDGLAYYRPIQPAKKKPKPKKAEIEAVNAWAVQTPNGMIDASHVFETATRAIERGYTNVVQVLITPLKRGKK